MLQTKEFYSGKKWCHSLRNISRISTHSSWARYTFKKPPYNKLRKKDIDIILNKPIFTNNIKDTFKSLHVSSITASLFRTTNYSCYGAFAWYGYYNPLIDMGTERVIINRKINNYLQNRPKGHFRMQYKDNEIYRFKYHSIENYRGIKEISDFEDEEWI